MYLIWYEGPKNHSFVNFIETIMSGPIELFLIQAKAPQKPWYVLSSLWDDAYKRTLAANRKE